MLQKIEVDGAEFYYRESGTGTPLIFIHGAAGSVYHDEKIVERFSKQYRVISYSQRHHLPNDVTESGDYGADQHALGALALMDALKIDKAVLSGHSYGGLVALTATVKAPKRILALELFEPSVGLLLTEEKHADILEHRNITFANIRKELKHNHDESAIRMLFDYAMGRRGFVAMPEFIQRDHLKNNFAFRKLVLEQVPPSLKPEEIASIKCPMTVYLGEDCTPVYRALAEEIQHLCPQTKLQIVGGASHDLIYVDLKI